MLESYGLKLVNIQNIKLIRACCIYFCIIPPWFWWGNLREGDRWGDPVVDGRIMLGWIYKKWDVGVRTGLGWLRIGIRGGRL
jgi:hypothetical protein